VCERVGEMSEVKKQYVWEGGSAESRDMTG
jgi:hypothetical protein